MMHMRAFALLALFAVCACAMQTVTVKMCAYQPAAPFKCDLNCTSFVVPANKCMWVEMLKTTMSVSCRRMPKCMQATVYRDSSCTSDSTMGIATTNCGCNIYNHESLLCLYDEVIVQSCKNSLCSIGCNTTLDAQINQCTFFQSGSFVGGVLVRNVGTCYMVDIKRFSDSDCDGPSSGHAKGSGDCNDIEYVDGRQYSVSYSCSGDI